MNLQEYLESQELSDADFAEKIGKSRATIWRYINGVSRPEWATVKKIEAATEGAVQANDWADG